VSIESKSARLPMNSLCETSPSPLRSILRNSSNFSGDKLNTLVGLMINAMQHGMIYVGTGMMPAPNEPDGMKTVEGPSSKAHNRASSFVGPMACSFNVKTPDAPGTGDLETAEMYGARVATIAVQLRGKK